MATISELGAAIKAKKPGRYDQYPDSTLGRMASQKLGDRAYELAGLSAPMPSGGGTNAQLNNNGLGVQAARFVAGAAPTIPAMLAGMAGTSAVGLGGAGFAPAMLAGAGVGALETAKPYFPGGPTGPMMPSAAGMANLYNGNDAISHIASRGIQGGAMQAGSNLLSGAVGKLAAPLTRMAFASPQWARLIEEKPDLPEILGRMGITVGGESGTPAADRMVATQAAKLPPLMQQAHANGYSVTPSDIIPEFMQQISKKFKDYGVNAKANMEAAAKWIQDWVNTADSEYRPAQPISHSPGMGTPPPSGLHTGPDMGPYPPSGLPVTPNPSAAPPIPRPNTVPWRFQNALRQKESGPTTGSVLAEKPLDIFQVNTVRQGADAAAERVRAEDAAAMAGKFARPDPPKMFEADLNQTLADVLRRSMRKAPGVGTDIEAVNAKLSDLISARQAAQAAYNTSVPTSPGLHPMSIGKDVAGSVMSRMALGARPPLQNSMMGAMASPAQPIAGSLPYGLTAGLSGLMNNSQVNNLPWWTQPMAGPVSADRPER